MCKIIELSRRETALIRIQLETKYRTSPQMNETKKNKQQQQTNVVGKIEHLSNKMMMLVVLLFFFKCVRGKQS